MLCMRCGRELKEDGQVFCPDCQDVMRQCPVAPGTPIQIPQRAPSALQKKRAARKKKELKPEEQIAKLRASNRLLGFTLFLTVLSFALVCCILLYSLGILILPF